MDGRDHLMLVEITFMLLTLMVGVMWESGFQFPFEFINQVNFQQLCMDAWLPHNLADFFPL